VEIISKNLTFANIIYSSFISWWAFIVSPQNLLLMSCHAFNVLAQGSQLRRLMADTLARSHAQVRTHRSARTPARKHAHRHDRMHALKLARARRTQAHFPASRH
jgi:hypothetical protein